MKAKLVAGLGAIAVLLAFVSPVEAQKSKRPQIAVMDFDYGTVHDRWWGEYDIGKGMADQVVDELVNDGSFRVIERKKLDTILAEQDFAHSDRAAPSAAKMSRIGKVLGVRYILTGSITKFYAGEKKGGGIRIKGIGIGGGKSKSEVKLTARLVDTTTGEILISAKGSGKSGKGGSFSFSKGGTGVNMGGSNFRESAIGEAQEKACEELVTNIVKRRDRLE
jgi:curli biogenesis system outer membrane secretion channel CsgG